MFDNKNNYIDYIVANILHQVVNHISFDFVSIFYFCHITNYFVVKQCCQRVLFHN